MLQFTCQKTHSGYKIPVITFFFCGSYRQMMNFLGKRILLYHESIRTLIRIGGCYEATK